MTTAIQGQTIALLAFFYEYEGGPAQDVTGLTITITAPDATIPVGPTGSGITHLATGVYRYSWAVSADAVLGDYVVSWSADTGDATEVVSVTSLNAGDSSSVLPWYCTREDVKAALDVKETARADWQVDEAISAVSRSIEHCTNRVFYPQAGTRYFDWPNLQNGTSYKLWLEQDEVISVSSVSSGGTTIPTSAFNLEPVNQGPPYDRVELKLSGSASYGLSNTHQRDVAMTGVFGYRNDETAAGALLATVSTTTTTTITCTDPRKIGVGSLIRVDSERMVVTEKAMATSGQTLQTPLTAANNNEAVAVGDGTAFHVGEVILLDSERMRIDDITGNNLTVTRAWDGSTLATHTGSTIYRQTSLTVARGVLGTSAATHSVDTEIVRWTPPGPIRQLARAAALDAVLQEQSGYARIVGSGDNARGASGASLRALWAQVEEDFRRLRLGVV